MTLRSVPTPSTRRRTPARDGIVTFSDVKAKKMKWLWPKYLPQGKVVILEGDPGLGKSLITVDWCARLSTGAKWPDGSKNVRPCNTIILSREDDPEDTIKPRLLAAGADTKRVMFFDESLVEGEGSALELSTEGVQNLRRTIKAHNAKMVVIDVLMAYMTNDAYRDQAVRKMLTPLSRLATETGCTFVLLRHLTKAKNKNAKYRGSGSIGILGAARMSYVVAEDPDTGLVYFTMVKTNVGHLQPGFIIYAEEVEGIEGFDDPADGLPARIAWEQPLATPTVDDLHLNVKPEVENPIDDVQNYLRWYFANKSGSELRKNLVVKEAIAATDAKKSTVYNAISALGIHKEFDSDTGIFYWSWPKGVPLDE